MPRPLYVYDNWSAYDELSDSVPLTEELAMRQLKELLRLRANGVQFDAYLMDAFWNDPSGSFLTWRADRWPNGPDAWLDACHEEGIKPGLWFPANTCFQLEPAASWKESLASDGWGFCCFEGGFLNGFISALRHWYERGVRVFKFDFAEFSAAPDDVKLRLLPSEIRTRNVDAYSNALKEFKRGCPGAILCAYNGFEEAEYMTWTDRPFRRVVDPRWVGVFDSIYCGDPRPADLPLPDFWRTLDVYADHMVRQLHDTGLTLADIDNCAFMMGRCGTCYGRGNVGWKASYLLSLARAGRVHMTLGNLEQFSDEDGEWMTRAQSLFDSAAEPVLIGGIPGRGEPYGYAAGSVVTVANPSLERAQIDLPDQPSSNISYVEGDFEIDGESVTLGPLAVAVLCDTSLSHHEVHIPKFREITCTWLQTKGEATTTVHLPKGRELHICFSQFDEKGLGVRTVNVDGQRALTIEATIEGREAPIRRIDPVVVWSGMSWAYGILNIEQADKQVEIRLGTSDLKVKSLQPKVRLAL